MSKTQILILITGIVVTMLTAACKHSLEDLGIPGDGPTTGNEPCDPNKVYFQQQVLPVLVSNCALSGCHDDASREGGVILTSYENVLRTGGIRAGNPGESELYKLITEVDPDKRMPPPPQSPLTQEQIRMVRLWIDQGAKNLVCANMCDTTVYTYSGAIRPIIGNKCQGCHSGTNAQGGIDLGTYAGVRSTVLDGRLWGAVNHLAGYSPMPRNGAKLSDCEIDQVRKWIDSGALEN